ncbi:nucleoside phosphorylase [Desulfogranum marinum]|uniref:nucleoside phosphorylase n=1 Tax=Desulfogranum marinum TaxID=453220 RepID=UPI0019634C8E|nr:nucleoside phosphorylase [Desulfogranum marinum]MBM9511755.1 nucleoside phosphorylase [Desulfogranum marinum]
MEQCIVNPVRDKRDPELPPLGIFAVNPTDAFNFPALAEMYGLQQHFLFHSKLYSSDRFFLAGPAVGAPMAAMCLEKCIALGARYVIVYGWCGAVCDLLASGDVFLPTSGFSEEGTSDHYPGAGNFAPDVNLMGNVNKALSQAGYNTKQGPVWTIDAVYRETKAKVRYFGEQGALGVDMEYTALSAVAAFRGISLAAVMLVSDELYHEKWRPQFNRKTFRRKTKQLLADLCREADGGGLKDL